MDLFLLSFTISMIVTYIFTVVAIKLSKKFSFVDIPKRRNIHKQPIPILGGLAIFIGVIVNLLVMGVPSDFLPLIIGAAGIFLIGIIDDKWTLKAPIKVFFQFLIISYLFVNDIKIEYLTFPFNISPLFFGPILSFFITQLWLIVVINMFNLIDGVDGLATGVSLITASILFIVSLSVSPIFISLILVSLIGSSLSFLKFNFFPAKIFLGDSGSLLLGYFFAVISVIGVMKSTISFIMLGFIFALPLMDLMLSVLRRLILKKNIFKPDLLHIHHQLVRRGISTPKAVFILYSISAIFGLMALFIIQLKILVIPYVISFLILVIVFCYFNYLQLSSKRFKSYKKKN